MNLQQYSQNLGGSGGGGTGANQALSNLTNPTAINQNLHFNGASDYTIDTPNNNSSQPTGLNINSGSTTNASFTGGNVTITLGSGVAQNRSGIFGVFLNGQSYPNFRVLSDGTDLINFVNFMDTTLTSTSYWSESQGFVTEFALGFLLNNTGIFGSVFDGLGDVGFINGNRPGKIHSLFRTDTGGVLSNSGYQYVTSSSNFTINAGTSTLILDLASPASTMTITMPPETVANAGTGAPKFPCDGQELEICAGTNGVTTLTLNANTGQTIVYAPSTLQANSAMKFRYKHSNKTWYFCGGGGGGGGGSYVFTQPLSVSGSTVSLAYDNSTIGKNGSNQLYVIANGITNNEIGSGAALSGYVLTADGAGNTSWLGGGGGGGGANTSLSNLSSVGVNASIIPATTTSIDLGSTSKLWNNIIGVELNLPTTSAIFSHGLSGQLTQLQQSGGGIWQQNGINYMRFNNDNTFVGVEFFAVPVTWNSDGGGNIGFSNTGRPGTVYIKNQVDVQGVYSCRGTTIITSGTASTVGANIGQIIFNPGSQISTYTLTMPASPQDGMYLTISAGANGVTTLTVSPNTSQSVSGAPSSVSATTPVSFIWNNSTTTWFRC